MTTAHPDRVGILNVDKPGGWTSHDVVARVRRLAGQKRVGHAGTLDPMATGVLPVLLGRATRLADLIQAGRKTYQASIRLGIATDTDDAEGTLTEERAVPECSSSELEAALNRFRGEILQVPPRYSAVQVSGQRAYAVARRGGELDLQPRRVRIYDLHVLARADATLDVEVTCGRGTYVRALARDLAAALGTVGHLVGLVRTRVGPFGLDDAVSLERLAERGVEAYLLSPDRALPDAPRLTLEPPLVARLANGQALACAGLQSETVWVYAPSGGLVCLASADGHRLRSRVPLAVA